MKRVEIRDLYKAYQEYDGKVITVCGWARTIRDSKNIAFVSLNDGAFSCLQIVVEREKIQNYDEVVKQTAPVEHCPETRCAARQSSPESEIQRLSDCLRQHRLAREKHHLS